MAPIDRPGRRGFDSTGFGIILVGTAVAGAAVLALVGRYGLPLDGIAGFALAAALGGGMAVVLAIWIVQVRLVGPIRALLREAAESNDRIDPAWLGRTGLVGQVAGVLESQRDRSALFARGVQGSARGWTNGGDGDRYGAVIGSRILSLVANINQIPIVLDEMQARADQVLEHARHNVDLTEHSCAAARSVAAASQELSVTIGEIAERTTGLAAVIRELNEKSASTQRQVADLAAASDRIGAFTRMIQDFAGQTNLVALNATIEAAGAGEAGRGFVVVAADVKTLAGQTAQATAEMTGLIVTLQSIARETAETTSLLLAGIGSAHEIITGLSTAATEQEAAVREVARIATEIPRLSGEILGSAHTLIGASQANADEVGKVRGAVHSLLRRIKALEDASRDYLRTLET